MKKIFLMAAAVAMVFTACTKENNGTQEPANLNVVLKIPNVEPATRAIGAPGVTPAIVTPLTNGHVFIINSNGSINTTCSVALNVNAATGASGQTIPNVPSDAKIFVLGNIPSDVNVATPTTLAELLATASAITTQTDYTVPALGNAGGTTVGITATSTTEGTATVQIRPLYARIELAQVVGTQNTDGDKVEEFSVTGVWVDAWHPQFTMQGLYSGTIFNQLTATDFTANTMGNTGTWAAAGTLGNMIAVPATGESWYYHVPAGGLPRLIVRVEGVKYELSDGTKVDVSSDVNFITVKGYKVSGATLAAFEAGRIYKIGGTAGITFEGSENLYPIPNPDDIELTLNVEIVDWVIVNPDAELY